MMTFILKITQNDLKPQSDKVQLGEYEAKWCTACFGILVVLPEVFSLNYYAWAFGIWGADYDIRVAAPFCSVTVLLQGPMLNTHTFPFVVSDACVCLKGSFTLEFVTQEVRSGPPVLWCLGTSEFHSLLTAENRDILPSL